MYDDNKKIVFCYVPKIGSTKWRYTFLLLNGKISFNAKLPKGALMPTMLKGLSKIEREKRLADYFKYVIVRNPMERLVSGYINIINKPLKLNGLNREENTVERLKTDILLKMRPEEYNAWLKNGRKGIITASFPEFIQFLNFVNLNTCNQHIRPIIHHCHPCAVNYDFYGNFKLLPNDGNAVLEYLKLNSSYYDNERYVSHLSYKTSDLVHEYFSQLTTSQKKNVFRLFADELDFYYSLYPEEKDSHLKL